MKIDRKTKAVHNPAKLKTNNSKDSGSDTGKKPDRSVTRTKRAKGKLPGIEQETPQTQAESIGSRQRLLSTYEHAPIGIIENSLEGKYVNCNEEFCRITGYGKEELLSLAIKDLTYEEDYIFDIKLHQRLIAGEIPFYKLEKRYVRKDGEIIWAEVTRSLLRDAEGNPLYTISAVLDVSERRQAEQALTEFARQQEALYKLANQLHRTNSLEDVFNAALDAILSALQCNRASILLFDDTDVMRFAAWRGLSDGYRQATEGHSPWKPDEKNAEPIGINDIGVSELSDLLKAVIQQEGIGSLAFIPLVSNGKLIGKFMTYFNAPHIFSESELDLSLTIARQLAFGIDRKRAEESLRASEALYRTIARSIPGGGVYVVDKDFRYLVAEGLVTEAFGLSREILEGHTVSEVFKGDPGERMKGRLQRNFEGETISYETKHKSRVYWTQQAPLLDSIGHVVIVTMDITEQKQTEQALQESKERYRNLFDLVPVAVYSCDADGMIQEYNQRALDLWGREPHKNDPNEKYCGSFKIYYPDGRFMPHAACPMARMLGGETLQPHELEILVERPDGLRRNVLAHPLALKNERGEIIGAINCLYDITERKQAEEKIIFQANLLSAVGSAVIATDLNGIVLYWNPAAEKLYGWSSSEALGKNVVDVAPAPQSQEQAGEIMNQLASGKSWSGDFLVQRKDGSTFPAFVSDSPILDSNGKLVGIIGVSSDISDLKQAEEALQQLNLQLESRVQSRTEKLNNAVQALCEEISERKQAEELLRRWAHIFEHADWGIATIRQDTFMMVNPTYAKMHGYTAEELVGHSIYKVFAPESHADLREQIRIAYENGHHVYESKHIRGDGSIFPVLVDTTVVWDENGNLLYRAVNVQDITERKRVEQELHESRGHLQILSRRLVEVQEEERRAIARELHDRVGQTLAALNINLMIMNGQLLEDSKQRIGSRMSDTMRLVAEAIALVRNVMTDLRPAVLDDYGLEAALQSYIDEYKSRYGIQVLLDQPATAIPRLGPSVEMTLLRIAQEALFNIARHAQADLVNVSLRLHDNAVHLMVQDNGVGIQSWQEANRPGSHGLTIMRERADAFGGSLNVGSIPGKGTKVEVSIPLQNGSQNKVREEKQG